MKKIIGLLLLSWLLVACKIQVPSTTTLKIKGQAIKAEIAQTPAEQIRGLSFRRFLAEDEGMLFIYPDYQTRNFWMKDMKFPLDILWLKDNQIVGFVKNIPAPTSSQLMIYQSNEPVNYVLELKAGWLEKNQVQVGDKVEFLTNQTGP